MASANEFRKRGAAQGSLPRPGFSSPTPPPRPAYNAGTPQGYSQPAYTSAPSRPAYAAPSPSYGSSSAGGYSNSSGGYNNNSNNGSSYGGSSNGYGGYGNNGYTNGLSSGSNLGMDDKYSKKPKRKVKSSSSGPSNLNFGLLVGGIALFIYAITMTTLYFSKSGSVKSMLNKLDLPDTKAVISEIENLQRKLKTAEVAKRSAETNARNKMAGEVSRLEKKTREAKELHKDVVENQLPEAHSKIEKYQGREKAFMDQVGWLMDRTRLESKRMVLERFGPGPHKVQITYVIRGGTPTLDEDTRYNFIIELAPLDKVPHAIHLFLEQVDHGLLEDTHFYLNGPHIVQAGPQPDWNEHDYEHEDLKDSYESEVAKISSSAIDTLDRYERKAAESKVPQFDDDEWEAYYTEEDYYEEDRRIKKYVDLGLSELAFPDYSDEFPHLPWTVGFTGRPGGPDWYINKVDNTKSHGPGGQVQHDLHEQGDSCFGTISSEGDGRSQLAANIFSLSVYDDKSEWHHFCNRPVRIVHAEILTKEPILDRHLKLTHIDSQHKIFGARRKKAENARTQQGGDAASQNGTGAPVKHGNLHLHGAAEA